MPKLKHKAGKIVFEKYESPYRAHLVEESILQQSPEIEYNTARPQDYYPNQDNEEIYEKFDLAYFDSYQDFRNAMMERYRTGQGKMDVWGFDKNNDPVLEESAFTKVMEPRLVRFWEEYLRRDELITSGKYEDIRANIFVNNVLDALGYEKAILSRGENYSGRLDIIETYLKGLSTSQITKLANERDTANDSKARVFFLDIFYIAEGVEKNFEQSTIKSFFDKAREILPETNKDIDALLLGDKDIIQQQQVKAREREYKIKYDVGYEETQREATRIYATIQRNIDAGINKSLIKRSKRTGRRYVLFKSRKESDAIINYLDTIDTE